MLDAVFIGGCGRSGTTMLGAMLGSHSRCFATPETHFKTNLLKHPAARRKPPDPWQLYLAVSRVWQLRSWEGDYKLDEASKAELGDSYASVMRWVMRRYAAATGRAGANIWIDHTPVNVCCALTLVDLFPQCKFVHVVRDGRAVAASVVPLDWGPNSVVDAAGWWVESVAHGLAIEGLLGPDRVIRVRYEDVVRQPEEQMRRLAAFLGLEFEQAMVDSTGYAVPRYTKSMHELVGRRPDPSRIDAWQGKLTDRQVHHFEAVTYEFLRYLGYDMRYGFRANWPTRFQGALTSLGAFCRTHVINPVLRSRRKRRGQTSPD